MARTILAMAMLLVAAACGDAAAPAQPVEPSTTDTTLAAATTLAVTTTTTPGWDTAAAAALVEATLAAHGWRLPAGDAFTDLAADACSREVSQPLDAVIFGDQLVADVLGPGGPPPTTEQRRAAARLGWALAAASCPDRVPDLAAGPPDLAQLPPCDRIRWQPHVLPWGGDPRPADRVRVPGDGTLELAWDGPTGEALTVTWGRGGGFTSALATGESTHGFGAATYGPASRMGTTAWVTATDPAVTVAWEGGPQPCDGVVAVLEPNLAERDEVALIAAAILPPLSIGMNDAELRVWEAALALRGYEHVGGEPSHGGGDAATSLRGPDGTGYGVRAVPVDLAADLPAGFEVREQATVVGVDLAVAIDPATGRWLARGIADGYAVEMSADAGRAELLAFAAAWLTAWLAA